VRAPVPGLLIARARDGAFVHAVPIGGRKIGEGVDVRPAAAPRLGEQRLVVLLRRREAVRAHDRFARIVELAVAPRPVGRVTGRDQRVRRENSALDLRRHRAVAAEVALVVPERFVGIEIRAGEEVDGQRLDVRGQLAGAEPVERLVAAGCKRITRPAGAYRRLVVHARGQRPAAPDALKADVRHVLRQDRSGDEKRGQRPRASQLSVHGDLCDGDGKRCARDVTRVAVARASARV
jgi:hypothetical protein